MSDKPVRQVCPTWDRTILSDAMSNKPGSMGLSDMGSVNCVRSCVEQQCLMSLSDMGSNRLFDPMSDNICPMSFYSSDRLFDSFESVAEQASDEFSWRAGHWPALRAQFASRSLACSRTQFAEQASDLHRKLSSPSRPVTCSRTQFAEQVIGLLANSVRRAGHWPARELSSPSRPVTCSQTQFAEQASDLLANSVRRAGQ
ncbi:hypothetical protein PCANC_00987 [Puccinia coronata f. sp. avenae]|uniref:Uncharacterized protein n=1 Tax=Puccinia coronata f. sp. avenae TaxID=200324 RepID=A0A2N5W6K4_9BASI|nr:hypothetical protein PCANC_00987 [Puccinia coronata f. sp. avenae]